MCGVLRAILCQELHPTSSTRVHHVLTMEAAHTERKSSGGFTQALKERYKAACSPPVTLAFDHAPALKQQQQHVTPDVQSPSVH